MSHLAIWEMEGEKMAGSGECIYSWVTSLLLGSNYLLL